VTGAPIGFAGPVELRVKTIADYAIKGMKNMITGANKQDMHLKNVNIGRDFSVDKFADLRMITPADSCPRCGGPLDFKRGIEVGHVFKLGTKYSKAMHAVYLDEHGEEKPIFMGCYGIGVGRTVAAAIEQNNDRDGIIFPITIAPFEVVILPLQMQNSNVVQVSEELYRSLSDKGVDVLLDDRDIRAGIKFKDADLLGTPVRITIGARTLKEAKVEMKLRSQTQTIFIPVSEAPGFIADKVRELHDSIK